ncbi:hypothetical protein A7982_13007 [Minicystis rosea]|nr:hypothetical protein A7982_13007 [Minicystis rosea]
MNLKLTLAGALALIPTFVAVPAFAQTWPNGRYESAPPIAQQRGYTELRIAPPQGGQVYVYEGRRLLGRFDQPGSMIVATGRDYRVIASRGDAQIWSGDVTAAGVPVDLNWAGGARYRTPIAPPPAGYATPPGYDQAPPLARPMAPVMTTSELRALLRELDDEDDDQDRMDALAEASARRSFAVPQASWILGRFRSDAYRLVALERLRDRIVGREDAGILLQRFRSPAARQQAAEMLGW